MRNRLCDAVPVRDVAMWITPLGAGVGTEPAANVSGMTETTPKSPAVVPGQPRRRRWAIMGAVGIVVAVAILAALLVPSLFFSSHRVEGTIMLITSSPNSVQGQWDDCSGQGGYGDIRAGAPATMRDGAGNVVGTLSTKNLNDVILAELAAELRPVGMGATPEAIISNIEKSNAVVSVACILHFSGEVKDAEFYTFEFSNRGEFTYSRAELNDLGWYIQLSLGR